MQSGYVGENELDRYAYQTTVQLGTGPQEIDIILTPYIGDADLYVIIGASSNQEAGPDSYDLLSERSTGADGIAVRYSDPKFLNSSCAQPPYTCRLSIGVYVS